VPLVIVGRAFRQSRVDLRDGSLSDVAPTILDLMEIAKPSLMSGESLIKKR